MSDADERNMTVGELARRSKTPVCGNCRWWRLLPVPNAQGKPQGTCHGNPVQVTHLVVQTAEPTGRSDAEGNEELAPRLHPVGTIVGYPPVAADEVGCRVFEPSLECALPAGVMPPRRLEGI